MVDPNAVTVISPKPRAPSPVKNAVLITISLAALTFAAWYAYQQLTPEVYLFEIADIPRETNQDNITAEQLLDMPLVNEQGEPVALRDRLGKEHLVIVFTRGSLATVAAKSKGPQIPELPNVCPYCSSQATGIASRMAQFTENGAAVLLVFPVSQLAENKDAATLQRAVANPDPQAPPPFPILLDLKLQAVEQLGIRDHLARPASFIIDKAGNLRFAYVARQGSADRPSGGELLRHIEQIEAEFAKPK